MNEMPVRISLVSQVKAFLLHNLQAGAWSDCLPSEMKLCERLKISRMTLRLALAQLVAEKVISAGRGQPRRILHRPGKLARVKAGNRVALLMPAPLETMPRFELYWIDDIREHLADAGFHLEIQVARPLFTSKPQKALAEIAKRLEPAGWILLKSTRAMQSWFSKRGEPAVIAGSRYDGVNLPFVDINHKALCRHAAGQLLAKGHRRLAFLSLDSGLAGDRESEEGFQAGVRAGGAGVTGVVVRHNGAPAELGRKVAVLLGKGAQRPTGFLVSKAYHTLTVLGQLQRSGVRVPLEASVISRDSESYLDHLIPEAARYVTNPETLARGLFRVILEMITTGVPVTTECRVMPQFIAGGTLAPCQPAPL